MISALLWKDFRVNLVVLAFGAAVLVVPPLSIAGINLYGQWAFGSAPKPWSEILVITAPFGLAVQLLTIAGLAGGAIASERADRSAEFLAYLPPSRWMIVASKAILAIGAALLIWIIYLVILYVVAPGAGQEAERVVGFRAVVVPVFATTSVLLFGAGWLASSFMSSHTLAAGVAIAAPMALVCSLAGVDYFFELRDFDLNWWHRTLCLPLGIGAFLAGVACYVRRVEP